MVRGRRSSGENKQKKLKRVERIDELRKRLTKLPEELIEGGYGDLLDPPGSISLTEDADYDKKTKGWVGKAREPLAIYLQRVSPVDNFSQRPPYDHLKDPIYRRLMRDFLQGALVPEAKVAALLKDGDRRASDLTNHSKLRYSIIDGLQRLYCLATCVLLVKDRESLVRDGLVPQDAWDYLEEAVEALGDKEVATRALLGRQIRYEIFYNIDLGGLLHYMVTFNTGQRRMSLGVQIEIMQAPLIDQLESADIPVFRDAEKLPGSSVPKDQFAASDLVLAAQAFWSANPQLTAGKEAEAFLNSDKDYLDEIGEVEDVVSTLSRIATDFHPRVMKVYGDDSSKRFLVSAGGIFLVALAAACGHKRKNGNPKILDGVLDKLMKLADEPIDDPLGLEEYQEVLTKITSSRGKTIRRLVYDTFLRFFNGTTDRLEWSDTFQHI